MHNPRLTIYGLKADGSPAYEAEDATTELVYFTTAEEQAIPHHKFDSRELEKVLGYGNLPNGTHIVIDNEDAP